MALKPKPLVEAPPPTPLPDYLYATKPFRNQELAFNASRDVDVFGLLMAPGTGKTKVEIDTACDLFDRGKIDLHVILAPNHVHEQWVETEYPLHATVPVSAAYWRSGTVNRAVREVLADKRTNRLKVVSINLEGMSHPSVQKAVAEMITGHKVKLSVDESHKFKTPGAGRTKALLKLRDRVAYRRILTGTELTKGYEDLYAQFAFLDPGIIGCRSFTEFKHTYCITRVMGDYPVIVGYRDIDKLKARIAPYVFMAEKEDCLDLPPYFDVPHYVDLTPGQRRVYNDIRDEYLAELDSGTVVDAALAITRLQKFSQIAAGHIQVGGGKYELLDATPRLELAGELVEDARNKVLVWAEWQPDIEQVSRELTRRGIKHVTYYGGNSSGQNTENLRRFRDDPTIKAWVATPKSGGTGLTINEADTVVHYTIGSNYEDYKQARARNHRPGQTKPVTYHRIIARHTQDVKLDRAMINKEDLVEKFRDPAVFKQWLLED